MQQSFSIAVFTSFLSVGLKVVFAQDNESSFSACPLLGSYFPPPTISKTSDSFAELQSKFTESFDKLIQNEGSEDYGPITPNTTSFSVVLFGGSESMSDDPVFFEYHYTSPEDHTHVGTNLTSSTRFPVGDLSMVFTVYAWLVEMGENWEKPITRFLPELASIEGPFTVPWDDVTVGSLAGHMSGLSRHSNACIIDKVCDWASFVDSFAEKRPLFLPDTTPIVSYAAFQMLVFAMQRQQQNHTKSWANILNDAILRPLGITSSGLLRLDDKNIFARSELNTSQTGEPGSLSFVTSIEDLARTGHSILSSSLLTPAVTRRWLHPNMDTSNLRNGVGRPWEVYRARPSATSPILDVLTKSGSLGQYASYFGLAPDFKAGFAIVAHDSSVDDRKLDLNVYADVVSESLEYLQEVAAQETALHFAGTYRSDENNTLAILNITNNGLGLEVQKLIIDNNDMKAKVAEKLTINQRDLDFRLYPTNVRDGSKHQFVAVFQDKSAPVDMGTPTCITWQEVGATVGDEFNVVFDLDERNSIGFTLPKLESWLRKET